MKYENKLILMFLSLLGVSAQLFYVRNGLVNEYASKYIIPVSNSINSMKFHSVAAGRDVQTLNDSSHCP